MVKEITKIELTNNTGFPRQFACADTPIILKGTLCKLTDPRTCSASDGAGDIIAGIASMDKVASDGSLRVALWTDGIFEVYASGSIAVGANVISAGAANEVMTGSAGIATMASGAAIIGYALETATDGETLAVRVKL